MHNCTAQQVATYQLDKSKLAKSTAAHWKKAQREKITVLLKWERIFFSSLHFGTGACDFHDKTPDVLIRDEGRSVTSGTQQIEAKHMVAALRECSVN